MVEVPKTAHYWPPINPPAQDFKLHTAIHPICPALIPGNAAALFYSTFCEKTFLYFFGQFYHFLLNPSMKTYEFYMTDFNKGGVRISVIK